MTMKVELCVSAALVCGFAFAGPKDETAAAAELAAVRALLASVSAPVAGLKAWVTALGARADELSARNAQADGFPVVTRAELRTLKRDAANAAAYAAAPKAALAENFALQVTEPLSQEMVMPYAIPQRGEFTDEARLFLCRAESEPLSVRRASSRSTTARRTAD